MNDPIDPNRPAIDPNRPEHRSDLETEATAAPVRRNVRSEGSGAIIAVVGVAALIIVGMLYIMQPPADAPSSMSSEAPAKTAPAPVPAPAPAPVTPAPAPGETK
jgi:hypothetical protein